MGIELGDLSEGVESAAMGVAGVIGEFLQLAKHRGIHGGPQGMFQLRQCGDFPGEQELAQTVGEEGGRSHNAIVPPLSGALKRNYSRMREPSSSRWNWNEQQCLTALGDSKNHTTRSLSARHIA
jgi:hypothetical protein